MHYDNTLVVVMVAGVIFEKGNAAPTGGLISIVTWVFTGDRRNHESNFNLLVLHHGIDAGSGTTFFGSEHGLRKHLHHG